MERFYAMKTWKALFLLVLLETLCVGAGMGVPILAIFLGFPIGWWLARRATLSAEVSPEGLRRVFRAALAPSLVTFLFMAGLWLPQLALLTDPAFDAAEWGIPLVLYTPMASFWAWMALMVVISPVLQLLATIFGAFVVLMSVSKDNRAPEASEVNAPKADQRRGSRELTGAARAP